MVLFSIAFTVSSVTSFFVLHSIGRAALAVVPRAILLSATTIAVGGLAVGDLLRLLRGNAWSVGLSRQTPRRLGFIGPAGVVWWGLDTGVPLTTVRSTTLPLLGMLLVLSGSGTAWAGLAYATGFLAVIWALVSIRPHAASNRQNEPEWVLAPLLKTRVSARIGSLALTTGVGVYLALSTIGV